MKTIIIVFTVLISDFCFGQSTCWSTYFGGNGGEIYCHSVLDNQNNIYVFGQTSSTNGLATNGAHQILYGGNSDGFLAKFSASGNLLWATYYGGTGIDEILSACTDSNNNIIIAGITTSTTNISTPGSFQATGVGGGFVAKFNTNGVRIWGTYYNYGEIETICTDKNNNIIFGGNTNGATIGLSTPNIYHTSYSGGGDAFITKFNSNGGRIWGTYYGGSDEDQCLSITTDTNNNIYITGSTVSDTGISTIGAQQPSFAGDYDAYLAKFNSSGNILWATYCGGVDFDKGYSVCIDMSNNVIIAGVGSSMTGIATSGTHKQIPNGDDAFIVQYNSIGIKQWGTYYGGNDGINSDKLFHVTTNNAGEIFIAGCTDSDTGIATIASYRSSISGMTDGYFAKFSSYGILIWGSYFGGSNDDCNFSISISSLNDIIITGYTVSDSNIATIGAYNTILNGGSDAFIASFDSSGHIPPVGIQNFNETIPSLIKVYPNPAKDKITVSIKDYAGKGGSLVLTDIEGKVVKSVVLKTEDCSIDLKDLPVGVYLLQYDDGEVCETVKFVKE